MKPYCDETGRNLYILGELLGKGGEGGVYAIKNNSDLVIKLYYENNRTVEQEKKLIAMLACAPLDSGLMMNPPHVSIAWPRCVLYEQGYFVGYVMPRIVHSPDILKVFNPVFRSSYFPDFTWRHLHRTALNFATALNALHHEGIVMGDVNQKNVLVTKDALVTLIDTDSFQVRDNKTSQEFRCNVGVPEYTPPELQKLNLGSIDRIQEHDRFGLGVLLFQLLMEGWHPFNAVPISAFAQNSSNEEVHIELIRRGIFPYTPNTEYSPPPKAPRFQYLHSELRSLFASCFVEGFYDPSKRPTALQWIDALRKAESELIQCKQNSKHWYPRHEKNCIWCQVAIPLQQRIQLVSNPAPLILPQNLTPTNITIKPVALPAPIRTASVSTSKKDSVRGIFLGLYLLTLPLSLLGRTGFELLSFIHQIAGLIYFIIVLIKQFQNQGVIHGVLGLFCGIYTFIWGWISAERLGIRNVMLLWTLSVVISIGGAVIGSIIGY